MPSHKCYSTLYKESLIEIQQFYHENSGALIVSLLPNSSSPSVVFKLSPFTVMEPQRI